MEPTQPVRPVSSTTQPEPSNQLTSKQKTNTLGLIALATAIIGIIVPVLPVVAIIIGFISLSSDKKMGQGGKGLGLVAIIIGFVSIVLSIILVIVLFVTGTIHTSSNVTESNVTESSSTTSPTSPAPTNSQTSNGFEKVTNDCMSLELPSTKQGATITESDNDCAAYSKNSSDPNLNIYMTLVSNPKTYDAAVSFFRDSIAKGASQNKNVKLISETRLTVDGQPAVKFIYTNTDGITRIDTILKPKSNYLVLGDNAGNAFYLKGYGFRDDMVENYNTVLNSIRWN